MLMKKLMILWQLILASLKELPPIQLRYANLNLNLSTSDYLTTMSRKHTFSLSNICSKYRFTWALQCDTNRYVVWRLYIQHSALEAGALNTITNVLLFVFIVSPFYLSIPFFLLFFRKCNFDFLPPLPFTLWNCVKITRIRVPKNMFLLVQYYQQQHHNRNFFDVSISHHFETTKRMCVRVCEYTV